MNCFGGAFLELNGMVPWLVFGQPVQLFFQEDLRVAPVLSRYHLFQRLSLLLTVLFLGNSLRECVAGAEPELVSFFDKT